jgi:quercetin dioxygenase-like cupin family protein
MATERHHGGKTMTPDRAHVTAERPLDAPLLTFEIPALLVQLKAEPTWSRENHNAITLAKSRGLRVVLVAMRSGAVIPSHHTHGPVSVQVIDGELRVIADSQTVTLHAGQLVTLQAGIRHGVEAATEAAFLLTLSAEARASRRTVAPLFRAP